jgi:hypothetical protein
MKFIGTCVDKDLVEYLFGSVSEFRSVLKKQDSTFLYKGVKVSYDPSEDLHYFYSSKEKE